MDLLPSHHPCCHRGGSHGRVCPPGRGTVTPPGLAAGLGSPTPLSDAAVWQLLCGLDVGEVKKMFLITASSCLASLHHSQLIKHFLLLSTQPRPASLPPAHRAPAPSWLLSLACYSLLVLHRAFSHPVSQFFMANPLPWHGHGHHHFTLGIPRSPAGAQLVALTGMGMFQGDAVGTTLTCLATPPAPALTGMENCGRAKGLPGCSMLDPAIPGCSAGVIPSWATLKQRPDKI